MCIVTLKPTLPPTPPYPFEGGGLGLRLVHSMCAMKSGREGILFPRDWLLYKDVYIS